MRCGLLEPGMGGLFSGNGLRFGGLTAFFGRSATGNVSVASLPIFPAGFLEVE